MEVEGTPLLQVVSVTTAQGARRSSLAVASRWWAVARLWWRSSDRKRAWTYVAACAAFSLANVGLLLWISYAQNALQSSLSEKQADGFYAAVRDFVLIIILATPLFALTDYVDSCLTVAWRRWLTQHMLRAYFAHHAYFKLKLDPQAIDNPDQRICEDVRAFCATSVGLAVSIVRKVFNCVAFAGLLWSLAPRLAVFLVIYAVGGTWITVSGFGRRLMHLTYSVLQKEADLRFALVRVRENAESIAFYSGDQREKELAAARLAAVIATIFGRVRWEALLSLWQNAYSYATILLPSLLLHKRYFNGEIRFGDISQASFAMHTIEGALSYIVNHLAEISQLAAQTDRLDALLATLVAQTEGVPGGVVRKASSNGGVALEKLTLATPHGELMVCRDLSLALAPGQSLLIVGPSGVGKTSIMRAVAGLWSSGSGTVVAPSDMFFLPQRPYMPLGTLREQLTFPDSYAANARSAAAAGQGPSEGAHDAADGEAAARAKRGGSGSDSGEDEGGAVAAGAAGGGVRRLAILRGTATGSFRRAGGGHPEGGSMLAVGAGGFGTSAAQDEELRGLLDAVMLPKLLARVGGLDAEVDWAHVLSLGEQQRISVARLLHHRPAVAFLDEATSALDAATEQALYSRLQQHCACFISIAHRKQLAAFHTHVLEAQGDGAWQLHTADDFLRQLKE